MTGPQQKLVRDQGMCGDESPDGLRICILAPGHAQPHPWDEVGPLAPLFAQVREAFDAESDGFCAWCQCSVHEQPHASECEGQQALAVLSAIERHVHELEQKSGRQAINIRALYKQRRKAERHVQDMEKALREIESLPSQSEHWHENDVAVTIARAALPAREKGRE